MAKFAFRCSGCTGSWSQCVGAAGDRCQRYPVGPAAAAHGVRQLRQELSVRGVGASDGVDDLSAERDYFEGVLANREGHVAESVALLEKAIPQIRASNPMRTALALHALADNYVKSFRNN